MIEGAAIGVLGEIAKECKEQKGCNKSDSTAVLIEQRMIEFLRCRK